MKMDQISLLERHLAHESNLKMPARRFGQWVFKSRIHASARALERCGDVTEAQWEKFISDISARVCNMPVGPKEIEYMFVSKSLNQAMTVAVDFPNKEMRIFTVLDPGKTEVRCRKTVVQYVA